MVGIHLALNASTGLASPPTAAKAMNEPSQAVTGPFIVRAPFNDTSGGDCILQTPDGARFVVYRVILSLASPIWNDMFSLPQASESPSSARPVIPVEEDPGTMESLLTMLYPLPSPRISSYDQAAKLVQACDKYFIDVSRLDTVLHKVLRTTAALEADPLGVYALAWRLGMDDEAKNASRHTHRLDLNDPKVKSDLIRRSGSVNSLLALWDLRLQRENALDDLAKLARIKSDSGPACNERYHGRPYSDSCCDIDDFIRAKSSARLALQKPYPVCHDLKQFFGVDFLRSSYGCGGCQQAAEGKHNAAVRSVISALDNYPQSITRHVRSFSLTPKHPSLTSHSEEFFLMPERRSVLCQHHIRVTGAARPIWEARIL